MAFAPHEPPQKPEPEKEWLEIPTPNYLSKRKDSLEIFWTFVQLISIALLIAMVVFFVAWFLRTRKIPEPLPIPPVAQEVVPEPEPPEPPITPLPPTKPTRSLMDTVPLPEPRTWK